MQESPALILTLRLDGASFALLDGLRAAHFPPARNFLPAHITLFHALPGDEEPAIRATLAEVAAATGQLPLSFPAARFLGRGVALTVASPTLVALRGALASRWAPWLSAQDRQPYHPHVTIQNKVAPEAARALYAQLAAGWQPFAGTGEGLLLWRYLGGPWELLADLPFTGAGQAVLPIAGA